MARGPVRYEANVQGLGKVMRSRGMRTMLRQEALRGMQYAKVIAPKETGEYRNSFRVSSANQGEGRWKDRAVAYLHNDSDHALYVEYTDDYRTLGIVADIIENGV